MIDYSHVTTAGTPLLNTGIEFTRKTPETDPT